MQINYKKNGEFQKLYPKTLSGNVTFNNGQTIEEWKQEIDDIVNKKEDKFEELWSGRDNLTGDSIIRPSKRLSECNNGWLLVFTNSKSLNNFNYYYVPKIHLKLPLNIKTDGIKVLTGSAGGVITSKYIFVEDDTIRGHSVNENGDNVESGLHKVFEY